MNRYGLIGSCLLLLTLVACTPAGKEKQSGWTEMSKEEVASATPEKMQVSQVSEKVTLKGKEYLSTVERRPDETLPVVTNGEGQRFVDNRITLRLACAGKTLLQRSFTKQDFAGLVDARFMKYAILEGLVFDQVVGNNLVYAASVGYPQSDLYVPLRLVVSAAGQVVSIEREERLEEIAESREDNNGNS